MSTPDPRLAQTARILSSLSGGVATVGGLLPGTAGIVASAIAAALGLGADIAGVGLDPAATIERAKEADEPLQEMRARWAARRAGATR